jgi:hypothetical protein
MWEDKWWWCKTHEIIENLGPEHDRDRDCCLYYDFVACHPMFRYEDKQKCDWFEVAAPIVLKRCKAPSCVNGVRTVKSHGRNGDFTVKGYVRACPKCGK